MIAKGNCLIESDKPPVVLTGEKLYNSAIRGKEFLLVPSEGMILDYGESVKAWVCGRPYPTVANGWSSPVNVSGKVIQITKVISGNACCFAKIEFDEIEPGRIPGAKERGRLK